MNTEQPCYEKYAQYDTDYPPELQPIYKASISSQHVPAKSGWFQRNQKYNPQLMSLGAAGLVLMSGGMQLAYNFLLPVKYLRLSWFIGGIIGTVFGAIICTYINKKILYLLSSILIIISGILLAAFTDDLYTVTFAISLGGVASGLLFIPLLVLVGEKSVKRWRGMIASSVEALPFVLGMYLCSIFNTQRGFYSDSAFSMLQMIEVLSIACGVLAFIIAFFLYTESPVFYLVRNDENQAIDSLRRLQRPFMVTYETHQQLKEHKAYVAHNKEMSLRVSIISGLPALLKLSIYRGLIALSYSYLSYAAFGFASRVTYFVEVWTFIIIGPLRFLGVLISVFMIDSIGRKIPMLFGSLICGGISIGIALQFDTYGNDDATTTVLYLFVVFQFFVGIFIGPSSAYLSEAFPLAVKPIFIGISFIVEMLVQIICILASDDHDIPGFFYATASIFFIFFFVGFWTFPETKQDTLLDAQIKFRKFR